MSRETEKCIVMKKSILILLLVAVLVSSCGTYAGQGAYVGGQFGAIIGSAIGGITDGRRGHDAGTLIGMAGGAVLGAVIGNAADRNREERIEELREERDRRMAQVLDQNNETADYQPEGVFDPNNGGDDRITFDPGTSTDTNTNTNVTSGVFGAPAPDATSVAPANTTANDVLVIRNATFRDASGDGVLTAGEECTISFEIMNRSGAPVYDVCPIVYDLTENKHIHISENLHIESIMPGKGIRYTAAIKGDSRLKEGTAHIRVGVMVKNVELEAQAKELNIATAKK